MPVLEEIAKSVWKKEEELKELKSELDAVDRKIQLSLAPVDANESKEKTQKSSSSQLPKNEMSKNLTVQNYNKKISKNKKLPIWVTVVTINASRSKPKGAFCIKRFCRYINDAPTISTKEAIY